MTPDIRRRIGRPGPSNANFKGEWMMTDSRTGVSRMWVWISPEEMVRFGQRRAFMLRSRYRWNVAHPADLLTEGEVIHHRNEDTLDDSLTNLEKLPSQSVHAAGHFSKTRGPMSESHRQALSLVKRRLPDRCCDACGAALTRKQVAQGNRFCSPSCHYEYRRGKGRTGW